MIGIVTIHTPEIECYSRYTLEIFQKYCLKHGYALIIEGRNSDREPSWDKVLVLNKYHKLFDYLFWFDADLLINNMNYKLENITEKLSKPIGMCEDGTKYREYNCGSIVVKNDENVKPFLDGWWYLGEKWKMEHRIALEQMAINRWAFIAKYHIHENLIEKLPNKTMNSPYFKIYPKDNFIHHMILEPLDVKTSMAKAKHKEIVGL